MTKIRCIFCPFEGTLEDLKRHSGGCPGHPAVISLEAFTVRHRAISKAAGNLVTRLGLHDCLRGFEYFRELEDLKYELYGKTSPEPPSPPSPVASKNEIDIALDRYRRHIRIAAFKEAIHKAQSFATLGDILATILEKMIAEEEAQL